MILDQAARTARYSAAEIAGLDFEGSPPDAGELSRTWHRMLDDEHAIVSALPPEHAGTCVLSSNGTLCQADVVDVAGLVAQGLVHFHPGRIRGALPHVRADCTGWPRGFGSRVSMNRRQNVLTASDATWSAGVSTMIRRRAEVVAEERIRVDAVKGAAWIDRVHHVLERVDIHGALHRGAPAPPSPLENIQLWYHLTS